MKNTVNFRFFGFLLMAFAVVTFAVIVSNAQVQPIPPIVQGKTAKIHLASFEQTTQLRSASNDQSLIAATSSPKAQPPVFAIFVTGDPFDSGYTAIVMNVSPIPAHTVFGGTSDKRDYYAWYADEEVPTGYIWYSLDNQHKLAFTEPSSTAEYRFISFSTDTGTLRQYSANYNYGLGIDAPDSIVNAGSVGANPRGFPIFTLEANPVSDKIGVIIKTPQNYIFAVPQEAIKMVKTGQFTINTAKIPDREFPSGEYRFTVVDATGVSDNGFQLRTMKSGKRNSAPELVTPSNGRVEDQQQ